LWIIIVFDTLPKTAMDRQVTITEQRRRVRAKLGPGKGLLDWIKLCRRFKQQNSVEHTVTVTLEELRKHNKEDDCWTAFRGDKARTLHSVTKILSGREGRVSWLSSN